MEEKNKMLDGYKTYIGGAGFILSGVGGICISWYQGTPINWDIQLAQIWAGISIIGGRSAFKKMVN